LCQTLSANINRLHKSSIYVDDLCSARARRFAPMHSKLGISQVVRQQISGYIDLYKQCYHSYILVG